MKEIVGYWGNGNISELKTLLSRVFSQASVEKELQQVSYQKNDCFGALARWSFTNNSSISNEGIFKKTDFCQVSLSAAGISEHVDRRELDR